jgi:hypothetical protein
VLDVSVQKNNGSFYECVCVSNQQADLAMVTSVGIFDIFQRMSISNHREVKEVLIFEDGG